MCWKCPLCHQPGDWWKYWTISTPVSFPGVLCSLLAARWPITTLITILWPNGPANFLVQLIFNPSNNLFIQFMFAQLLHENAAGEFPAVKAVSDRCEFLIMNSSHEVTPAPSGESCLLTRIPALTASQGRPSSVPPLTGCVIPLLLKSRWICKVWE